MPHELMRDLAALYTEYDHLGNARLYRLMHTVSCALRPPLNEHFMCPCVPVEKWLINITYMCACALKLVP